MEATFINAVTGQPTMISLRGDFWGGSADLALGDGGPCIAQITRSLANMREIFTDNQTVSSTDCHSVVLISTVCSYRSSRCRPSFDCLHLHYV